MRILEKLAAASLATIVMGVIFALRAQGDGFHLAGLYVLITLYAAPVVYLLGISSSYVIEALFHRYGPHLQGAKSWLLRVFSYALAGALATALFMIVMSRDMMTIHEISTFYACGILTAVLYSLALALVRSMKRTWARIVCALGLPVSFLLQFLI